MRLALHIGVNRRYNGVPADEVEPALSFHRQLQSALHAYGLAGIVLCPACCRVFAYKITCLVRVEVDRTVTGIYGAGCLSAYLIDDAACVVEILVQFYFSLSLQKKDVSGLAPQGNPLTMSGEDGSMSPFLPEYSP